MIDDMMGMFVIALIAAAAIVGPISVVALWFSQHHEAYESIWRLYP
jgi:hypothetical protein